MKKYLVIGALLFAPVSASAATEVGVTVDIKDTTPGLAGGFGVYNFDLSKVGGVQHPFTLGWKKGHCVERGEAAGDKVGTLRSGTDLDFPGNPNRVQYVLQSSLVNSVDNTSAAAHQWAVWQVTDPGSTSPSDAAAKTQGDALYAASENATTLLSPANYSVVIGAGAACAGSSRLVTVKGSPFTTTTLSVTAGTATLQVTTLTLGSDGTGQTTLIDTGVENDAVTVSAALSTYELLQADNGGAQDFAYLQAGGNVSLAASVSFTDCRVPEQPPVEEQPSVEVDSIPVVAPKPKTRTTVDVEKRAFRDVYTAGDVVNYTLRVKIGKRAAKNLTVCDVLPDNMSYIRAPGARFVEGDACWFRKKVKANTTLYFSVTAYLDVDAVNRACNRVYGGAANASSDMDRYCVKVRKNTKPQPSVPTTG